MMSNEIAIIGGGPGGVAAALALAKAGVPCTLLEKATFPRDKVCGDAISGKVVATLNRIDPSIMARFDGHPAQVGSWGVSFVAPNRKVLRVPFQREYDSTRDTPPGYISKRIDFDHFLWQEAQHHPLITAVEGYAVDQLLRTGEHWIIRGTHQPEVAARLVIIANGAQSSMARTVGGVSKENKHYCAGIRSYWSGVKGMEKDGFIELHFVKNFLPGYLWIFPLLNGQANVGVGMRSDYVSKKKVNLKKAMLRMLREDPVFKDRFAAATMTDGPKGYGLPLGSKQRPISGDGFMLVGDAAALIDPFTGEGIGNAIISGKVAADTAAEALQRQNITAALLRSYDHEVYRKLWKELQLSYRLQQMVKYPWLFNLVVNKAHRNPTLQDTISCMFEDLDMRQRLKQPGFYWKLLFGGRQFGE